MEKQETESQEILKIKNSSTAGLPPGSLVYVGKNHKFKASQSLFEYSETNFNKEDKIDIAKIDSVFDEGIVSWQYSYPTFWGVIIVVTLGMFWFFRRK